MATLTVDTAPTTDFRSDTTFNVTDIVFNAGAVATGLFNSVQFNGIAIEADVEITGDGFIDTMRILMPSDTVFTAAAWTFTNWSADDNVIIIGEDTADTITGSSQRNLIRGGGGADTLTGGDADDHFSYGSAADIVAGESLDGKGGTDEILVAFSGATDFSVATVSHIERLIIGGATVTLAGGQIGLGGIDEVVGTGVSEALVVNGSAVTLSGVTFTDWTSGEDTITINGASTPNSLIGSTQNDIINGGNAGDFLNGSGGADILRGGGGSDVYVIDGIDDVVDESIAGSNGTDAINSAIDFSLADTIHAKGAIENLTLLAAALNATGNALANVLTGNAAGNTLDGAGAADLMRGLGGNDTYVVNDLGDVVEEFAGPNGTDLVRSSINFSLADATHVLGPVENLTLTGAATTATGNQLANTLTGNALENTLEGLEGSDILRGLGGNDTYIVENTGDVVDESQAGSDGVDLVRSSVSFNLASLTTTLGSVENLTLTGTATTATGNDLANVLTGNSASNVLFGGGGGDTLDGSEGADAIAGGAGDDTYIVDNAGDAISEAFAGSDGTDVVRAFIDFSLGNAAFVLGPVENLVLLGTAVNGTGNALANTLIGNAGANTLDGAVGNDTMQGLGGADTYIVDSLGDVVDEANGDGIDLVRSSVSFSLAKPAQALGSIENLTLTGLAATGNGNALANILTGNAGKNTLDGGLGNDTMKGLAGSDTYVVAQAGDIVDETGGNGSDLVKSARSFSLSDAGHAKGAIEKLTLTGSANLKGTGNGLANSLTGNAGKNTLDGRAGNDVMKGLAGSDIYVVAQSGDVVSEVGGGGIDLVRSTRTFSLSDAAHAKGAIEKLTLTGSGNINATGNALGNTLIGNSRNNTLDGNAGKDLLKGGGGRDTFLFDTALAASNVDRIADFKHLVDKIRLDKTIFKTLALGALDADAFFAGGVAEDANDRIGYNKQTGALFFDRDGAGGVKAVLFAGLVLSPDNLSFQDFTVVA